MGQPMTLEELKAENANEDLTDTETTQVEEEVTLEEAAEVETEEVSETGESSEAETEETEAEAWMQTDEPASEQAESFTGSDIKRAKDKLKAKLNRQHDEEKKELLQRIEALEGRGAINNAPAPMAKPKREDFYQADDPDEAYTDALLEYKLGNVQAKQAEANAEKEVQARQKQALDNVSSQVDQHYERAAKLADEVNISPEVYQSADLAVRQTIESVMPNQGDMITDQLISRIGDGSEKVMYYLGRNPSAQLELQAKLRDDSSGIAAAIYLGSLKTKIAQPVKRKTSAPKPTTQLKGGNTPTSDWQKKYNKEKDVQKRFDLKQEAKASGVDTKNW